MSLHISYMCHKNIVRVRRKSKGGRREEERRGRRKERWTGLRDDNTIASRNDFAAEGGSLGEEERQD